VTTLRSWALAFVPILVLATIFWKPALFDGKTIIHGDSITDGLSMLSMQARSFRHLGQLLWADGVYGGHPIFAEGQGAFASPLSIFIAWIVAPLTGVIAAMNAGHWLMMLLTGAGMIGLCRRLGFGMMASAFASLAVVFSPIWIGSSQNLTIQGALTWVPWAFWALEAWLERPAVRQSVLLGAAVALIILSGYPQAFHGAAVYMAVRLLAVPFDADARRSWIAEWRPRLAMGALAVLVCVGLSAVQWLPLLELTGLSRRSAGIGMMVRVPLTDYLRGLLYTWPRVPDGHDYFPGSGSLLVMLLAALSLALPTPARIKGHMVAALVLLQLGIEEASPLFRFVYHHDLLPGLRYFRTVHLYIDIAVIGFAVLAAAAIDRLGRLPAVSRQALRAASPRLAVGLLIAAFVAVAFVLVRVPDLRWTNYGIPLAALLGGCVLVFVGRARFVPCLMLALLIAECMNLRLHLFHFYDRAVLAQPASASAILATPGRDDKLFDVSLGGVYGFVDSRDPGEEDLARRMIEANCAMTNTMWGLRSITGALALPMRRQVAAENRIRDEVTGKVDRPPGVRLMDLLAVRFVAVDRPANMPGSSLLWGDPRLGIYFMENAAARPRFQLYGRHVSVASPDAALDTIAALRSPALVIENPPEKPQAEPADDPAAGDDPPGHFDILKAKSTEYRIDVTADRPAWFFVADANYPGWRATLDGKRAPLFSAQLLGKAVAIPPGRHRLDITFVSSTFIAGLSMSTVFLVVLLLSLWPRRRSVLHSP